MHLSGVDGDVGGEGLTWRRPGVGCAMTSSAVAGRDGLGSATKVSRLRRRERR